MTAAKKAPAKGKATSSTSSKPDVDADAEDDEQEAEEKPAKPAKQAKKRKADGEGNDVKETKPAKKIKSDGGNSAAGKPVKAKSSVARAWLPAEEKAFVDEILANYKPDWKVRFEHWRRDGMLSSRC